MIMKNIRMTMFFSILFFTLFGVVYAATNQIDLSEYGQYVINYEDREFADYLHKRLADFSQILDNTQKQLKSPYVFRTNLFSETGEISLIKADEKEKLNQYVNIIDSLAKKRNKITSSLVPDILSAGFHIRSSGDSIEVLYAKKSILPINVFGALQKIRGEFVHLLLFNVERKYDYVTFMYTYLHTRKVLEGYAIAYSDTIQPMIIKLQIKSGVPEEILVHGGSFQMGNTRDDIRGEKNEKPAHEVTLNYDFWIWKYEVTFSEYDVYCQRTGKSKPDDNGWGRISRPVINVSWYDAIEYCNWLSEQAGIKKAYDSQGNLLDQNGRVTTDITKVEGYRLPTEAEWEYAARGGRNSGGFLYAGSNSLEEVSWFWNVWLDPNSKTQPVGGNKENELGLHNITGNVSEWCHDWLGDYSAVYQTNPTGPDSGVQRVKRGASWGDWVKSNLRLTFRFRGERTWRTAESGFRLARTAF